MKQDNVRFLPADGDDREGTHISMTSGHACRVYAVGPDGKPGTWIPLKFRKLAIAAGCGIVGIEEPKAPKQDAATKQGLIVDAITKLVEGNDPETLEGDGRPKTDAVAKEVGFNVTKKMADDAWAVFVESLED